MSVWLVQLHAARTLNSICKFSVAYLRFQACCLPLDTQSNPSCPLPLSFLWISAVAHFSYCEPARTQIGQATAQSTLLEILSPLGIGVPMLLHYSATYQAFSVSWCLQIRHSARNKIGSSYMLRFWVCIIISLYLFAFSWNGGFGFWISNRENIGAT